MKIWLYFRAMAPDVLTVLGIDHHAIDIDKQSPLPLANFDGVPLCVIGAIYSSALRKFAKMV